MYSFYSYDDADIDIAKLSVQSSLKYFINEISENKDCVIVQTIVQNNCTLKVTKSKIFFIMKKIKI